jgi:selenide, water dikinase
VLRPIHDIFNPQEYPDLLVGLSSPDDAAVWKLDDRRSLVLTTDFFTPVVDDAYDYGAIAAANSLSDVYAMGGKPFLALNIAALPPALPAEYSSEIIRGGAEKARQAGVVIAGGHTVQDQEPKYGLVVVGFVDTDRYLSKAGAKPGDKLVLTKPLGFGVTTSALKREKADPRDVSEAVTWMTTLNKKAGDLAVTAGLKAATDITGFALLGHALEMANASKVGLRFDYSSIPFLTNARKYGEAWTFPGGASDNNLYFGSQVKFAAHLDDVSRMLLFDPQTSGGLLIAVPPAKLPDLLDHARQIDQPVWVIGEVVPGAGIEVV